MLNFNMDLLNSSLPVSVTPIHSSPVSFPFSVLINGVYTAGINYFTERSGHDFYLLLYTLSGEALITLKNSEFILSLHQAVLINAAEYHKYQTSGTEPWTFAWAHLERCGTSDYAALINQDKVFPVNPFSPKHFQEVFYELYQTSQHGTLLSCAKVSNLLSELLTQLLTGKLAPSDNSPHCNHDITFVIDYIQCHYQQALSIDGLIEKVHFSKYHFIRLFKKQTGTTPYAYLLSYRIGQGKRLLCTTYDSISEIANQVGFISESNFIHQFKSIAGTTPASYRKNNWGF